MSEVNDRLDVLEEQVDDLEGQAENEVQHLRNHEIKRLDDHLGMLQEMIVESFAQVREDVERLDARLEVLSQQVTELRAARVADNSVFCAEESV